MADIRPFSCIRPNEAVAARVAALPYDVYSRKEAKIQAAKDELSFLNIDRPETQFDETVDMYAPEVYEKAKELLEQRMEDGTFLTDKEECYYVYELTMNGRTQTGIAACAAIDDYQNGMIRKHENTREEKEQDRIRHVEALNMQTGPIFLAYRTSSELRQIREAVKKDRPLYDFVSEDGVRHRVFRIGDADRIKRVREAFLAMDHLYIADGHHRAASAVKAGLRRRREHPEYTGQEEFNYFLCVLFPEEELTILPYNRVVRDLNGYTKEEFLSRVRECFTVKECGGNPVEPDRKGVFGLYLEGSWYRLEAPKELMNASDPVDRLDVSILQDFLLGPVLGIGDPRTDPRIDFSGGIRGLSELEKRVNQGMGAAFSMYPTSIQELFWVADAGRLMPPKSTWFEPKLRSGLFLHSLEEIVR